MKRYWFLAAFGFAVLAFAAVWMGSLNQDEGWYLYAARLVSEGKTPYRDFFYTQAPVMPILYSAFAFVWDAHGLLGARILTMLVGAAGIAFFCALAARLAVPGRRGLSALVAFLLLGSNLYHLYYVAIPKTYALASLFVAVGFFLLSFARDGGWKGALFAAASGVSLAFASGTRISLGVLLAVVGFGLLLSFRSWRWTFLWFGIGGALALCVVYGPFLLDADARSGLLAAQMYHASRGGFDPVFTVGSLSRLVRWYAPLFVVLGMGVAFMVRGRRFGASAVGEGLPLVAKLAAAGFLAVFAVQMLAPFPYEDYQVPVMGLLAVFAALAFSGDAALPDRGLKPLLVLGLAISPVSPINKALWSPSFVLVVGAYSALLFLAFYAVIDVWGYTKWSFPLKVIGMNSIAIYMAQSVIGAGHANDFLFSWAWRHLPESCANLKVAMMNLGYVAVCWLFLYFLYRKNTFLKV